MTRTAILSALALASACSYAPPSEVVYLDGPGALDVEISAAVETWASLGATVAVGQIGPCSASEPCRRDLRGTHWSVVVVQDGTSTPAGVTLCGAGDTVTLGTADYASETIYVGACVRRDLDLLTRVIAHELGHVLLGEHHDDAGLMVGTDPATLDVADSTLQRACAAGWGC